MAFVFASLKEAQAKIDLYSMGLKSRQMTFILLASGVATDDVAL